MKQAPAILPIPAKSPPPSPGVAKSMCQGCRAGCCDLRVDLTPFDIARIVHQENKNPNEFVELVPVAKNDSYGFRLKYGLVKVTLRTEGGTCLFKRNDDLKCAIEKSKPAVCLVYPFSVNHGIPYIRREALCPLENRLRADYSKMSPQAIDDCHWEARRYEEIIRVWNNHAKGNEDLDRFLSFAAHDLDADRLPISGLRKGLGRFMLRIGLR